MFAKALVVLVAVAAVSCLPTTGTQVLQANGTKAAEDTGTVKLCVDANLSGLCENIGFTTNFCVNVPSALNDEISSLTIPGGIFCNIFRDINCGGPDVSILAPGSMDLDNQQFNDEMSSFACADL
ncbi:hypothetical protein BDQ17DRAFT_1362282 [Cyathus striatus]|nr:hypothetical protein BDQ17DRAFT_1362282 [Cyathus striatus]